MEQEPREGNKPAIGGFRFRLAFLRRFFYLYIFYFRFL